jgi:hypothetical protein
MYKSVYLNYDYQTTIILFIFLVYGQFLKEILTKVITECYRRPRNLRADFLICLSISVYSHFYGFWMLINYINDRDNRMLSSQIFFSLSELIPSYLYYKYLNRFENTTREIKPIKLSVIYPILFISVLHIYIASLERLLWGFFVTKFEDANRSRLRDFCLILNDLSGIILAIYWLFKENKDKKHNLKDHLFYIKSWTIICLFLYFFYYFFCSFEH